VSEALVFFLLLECAFALRARDVVLASEVVAGEEAKNQELLSYNVMLDFCLGAKTWVAGANMSSPMAVQELTAYMNAWKARVLNYINFGNQNESLEIAFSSLSIQPYTGQSYDRFQMAYVGITGNEKWFISGILTLSVNGVMVSKDTTFNIAIIS
jgi:hypothetical protein